MPGASRAPADVPVAPATESDDRRPWWTPSPPRWGPGGKPRGSSTTPAPSRPRRWPTGGRPVSPSSTCSAAGRSGPWNSRSTPGSWCPVPRPNRWSRWHCESWPAPTTSGVPPPARRVGGHRRPRLCGPRDRVGCHRPVHGHRGWPAVSRPGSLGHRCLGRALEVARENREASGRASMPVAAARVRLAPGRGSTHSPTSSLGRVDLVVSNPPYVAESEFPGLDPSVREWEPEGRWWRRRCRRCRRVWPPSRRSSTVPSAG